MSATPILRSTRDAVTVLTEGAPDIRGRRLATYRLFNLRARGVLTEYRGAHGECMWDVREIYRVVYAGNIAHTVHTIPTTHT